MGTMSRVALPISMCLTVRSLRDQRVRKVWVASQKLVAGLLIRLEKIPMEWWKIEKVGMLVPNRFVLDDQFVISEQKEGL